MANNKKKGLKKSTPPKKKIVAEPKGNAEEYADPTKPLMPELEELVKKDPNRLIGCGG